MAIKYASNAALQAVATKVKTLLAGKVNTEEGKGLSTNDLTNSLKANYDAAYEHSQAEHAPSNAQANVLESVKLNGVPLQITDKAVNVTVPTKVSDLTNDSKFQTDTQVSESISTALQEYSTTEQMNSAISSAVANAGHLKRVIIDDGHSLPEVGAADVNTIYMMKKTSAQSQNTFTEYMVVNNAWEIIGDTAVDLTDYAKTTEVQSMINNALNDYVTTVSLNSALSNYVKTSDMVEITAPEVEAMFS